MGWVWSGVLESAWSHERERESRISVQQKVDRQPRSRCRILERPFPLDDLEEPETAGVTQAEHHHA